MASLRDFLAPSELTQRMKEELRLVAANEAVAAHVIDEHENARGRMRRRQRYLFGVYCLMSLGAGMLGGAFFTFQANLENEFAALIMGFALFLLVGSYVFVAILSWPTQRRRSDELRVWSAAAAGRASQAVYEGVDLQWRRRVADGIATTAQAFQKRHRYQWFAPTSMTPLSRTTTRLAKVCARAIRTLVERALTTHAMPALRDDLWRLHLRVVAADFERITALRYTTDAPDQHGRVALA